MVCVHVKNHDIFLTYFQKKYVLYSQINKRSVGYKPRKKTIRLLVESGLDFGPCCNNTLPGQTDDVILGKREN